MTEPSSTIGFAIIVILYAVIGLLVSAGSIIVSQKLFFGRSEQVFYGILLAAIAGFYSAFVAFFGDISSWRTELFAVLAFSVLGVLGTRYPAALILGYWHTCERPVHRCVLPIVNSNVEMKRPTLLRYSNQIV